MNVRIIIPLVLRRMESALLGYQESLFSGLIRNRENGCDKLLCTVKSKHMDTGSKLNDHCCVNSL